MKKKKHVLRRIILIFILAAVLAGLALSYFRKQRTGTGSDEQEAAAMLQKNNSTAEVIRGSIDLTTEGNGMIEAADKQVYKADYPLTVDQVKAENGDVVKSGGLIATLDRDSVEAQMQAVRSQLAELNVQIAQLPDGGSDTVTAPVSGRVKRIFVKPGDLLTDAVIRHGGIMEISTDGNLKAAFTAQDTVKAGQKVKVSFLDYEEEGYISGREGSVYTAVLDDSADYPLDTEAQIKDEEGNLLGTGKLESNHPYLVDAAYGRADELEVDVNDWVDAGSTLLTRISTDYNADYTDLVDQRENLMNDLSALGKLKEDPQITAGGDGIISGLTLEDNTPVAAGQGMYSLISTDEFSLKAQIDELEIAGVKPGQSAKIVFDALENEVFEGKVEKVSALGNNVNGVTTFTVTISVPGSEELKTNMSASATIVTDHADDALLVPVDAIQTRDGQKYVTVVNGDTYTDRDVTLGLVNSTTAQITDGVSEGETVVVVGTSKIEDMMNLMQAGQNASGAAQGGAADD